MRQQILKSHIPQRFCIDLAFKVPVFRRRCIYVQQLSAFIGGAGQGFPLDGLKMCGCKVAQQPVAVCILKITARILIWKFGLQICNTRYLLRSVKQLESFLVILRGNAVIKLFQFLCGIQLRTE